MCTIMLGVISVEAQANMQADADCIGYHTCVVAIKVY